MNKDLIKQSYKSEKLIIDKAVLGTDLIVTLHNRRNVSKQHINSIMNSLIQGKHFDSPFVVNYKNGQFRLIDGNHRFEAIKSFIEKKPESSVEVTLNIYEDLSEKEEKELYTTYNQGKKQSTNDFIQQYKDEIEIYHIIQRMTLPVSVSVYPSKNAINFYKLIGAYLTAKEKRFAGDFRGKPLDFIEECKYLDLDDYEEIRDFLNLYVQIFGPYRNNPWFSTTPLKAIWRIYLDNEGAIPLNKITKFFRDRLFMDAEARDMSKFTGASSTIQVREIYLNKLNRARKTNLFTKGKKELL